MNRLWSALRVLFGARPAAVRFDEGDAAEALLVSQIAADAIVWMIYMGLVPEEVESRMWAEVQREVYEAVLNYAGRGRLHRTPPPPDAGPPAHIPF